MPRREPTSPFCPVCLSVDNKRVRLQFMQGSSGLSGPPSQYFCQHCANFFNIEVDGEVGTIKTHNLHGNIEGEDV